MPTYFQLFFGVTIFRSSIQDGDEIQLLMEQFPPDDILESLYNIRSRESEKLRTVSDLYNLEIIRRKRNLIITA